MPPTTTKRQPKLFSVSGTADGIKTELSPAAKRVLSEAEGVLAALGAAANVFPTAKRLRDDLEAFIENPTADGAEGA
jgi:hypothetical protein